MGRKRSLASAAAGVTLAAVVPAVAASPTTTQPVNDPSSTSAPDVTTTRTKGTPDGVPLPAGFDPLTASNKALQAHGLPPRPPGKTPSWWVDMVTTPGLRTLATGTPTDTHTSPPPPKPKVLVGQAMSQSGTVSPSVNWGFAGDYVDAHQVDYAESSWVMPWGAPFYLDSGDSMISSWVGIGDGDAAEGGDVLIQAGSSADYSSVEGPDYHCWWEAYTGDPNNPDNDMRNFDMDCNPGDAVKVILTIAVGDGGDATAYYSVYNVTQSQSRVAHHTIRVGWGNQVEFISERPTHGPQNHQSYYSYPTSFLMENNEPGYTFHDNEWTIADSSAIKNLSNGYTYKNVMEGCDGSLDVDGCTVSGSAIGYSSDVSTSGAFSTFRGAGASLERTE